LRERLGPNVLSRIVPCCVDEPPDVDEIARRRANACRELAFNDRTVIGYLGSASVWQQPEDMAAAFAEISRALPEAVFLILSPDQALFQALLAKHGVSQERYRLLAVPHAQVPMLAPAMDLGMLLRADVTVNRVASPTKFAEYLAAGVPVLLTEVLQDFAAMVRRLQIGVIWKQPRPTPREMAALLRFLGELQSRRAELALRCRELVAAELTWRTGGDAYWHCYEEYLLSAGSRSFRAPEAGV
jgi:glycosyltransferase involved in cell wall biosynthesis